METSVLVQATAMLVGGLTPLLSGQLPDRAPSLQSSLPPATIAGVSLNHCKNFEVVGWMAGVTDGHETSSYDRAPAVHQPSLSPPPPPPPPPCKFSQDITRHTYVQTYPFLHILACQKSHAASLFVRGVA